LLTLPEGKATVKDGLMELLPDYAFAKNEEPEQILYWLREKEKGAD
jgi:hypothetical protein